MPVMHKVSSGDKLKTIQGRQFKGLKFYFQIGFHLPKNKPLRDCSIFALVENLNGRRY